MRDVRLDDVTAGQHPRAEIALVHRGADVPVAVRADRRADLEERDAAGAIELQQLQRIIEGAGRQQVDLAAKREIAEERGGRARRCADGAAEKFKRIGDEPVIVLRNAGQRLRVAQHAALQMTQAPGELGLVAIAALGFAGRRCRANRANRRLGDTRRSVGPSRRSLNDEALRVDGRTLTIALRAARKPWRCTRTRYGPGGNCLSEYWPVLSETAKAVVPPSAEITAPSSGLPISSVTLPSINPVSAAAILVTGSSLRALRVGKGRVQCQKAEHDRSD